MGACAIGSIGPSLPKGPTGTGNVIFAGKPVFKVKKSGLLCRFQQAVRSWRRLRGSWNFRCDHRCKQYKTKIQCVLLAQSHRKESHASPRVCESRWCRGLKETQRAIWAVPPYFSAVISNAISFSAKIIFHQYTPFFWLIHKALCSGISGEDLRCCSTTYR